MTNTEVFVLQSWFYNGKSLQPLLLITPWKRHVLIHHWPTSECVGFNVAPNTKQKQKKTALANKTIYTLIWYAFYDLPSGYRAGLYSYSHGACTGPGQRDLNILYSFNNTGYTANLNDSCFEANNSAVIL